MSETQNQDRGDRPGKTRTWWHPLLARLMDHLLSTAYTVQEEVSIGILPLRVDILLIRREDGQLPEAARRELSVLLPLLNKYTLVEFKAPSDSARAGDAAQLFGYSFIWHGQQTERLLAQDVSLILLAPSLNAALRDELQRLICQVSESEPGIHRVTGLPFAAWVVETDVMAKRGQPVLSLVSRVFLSDPGRIIRQLRNSGHVMLLAYVLQLIHYFRTLGEDFAMQHTDTQYLGALEEELLTAVLQAAPVEKRLEGLSPGGTCYEGCTPEEVLQGFTAEELAAGLTGVSRIDRGAGCSSGSYCSGKGSMEVRDVSRTP